MKEIDARGKSCPLPIVMTRSALNDPTIAGNFLVLCDSETSKENIEQYLSDNGIEHKTEKNEDHWAVEISKSGGFSAPEPENLRCPSQSPNREKGYIICFKSKNMEPGNEELGDKILQNFVNTVISVSPLPEEIIFYNSGVLLLQEGHPCQPALKELEERGVTLTLCGTCVTHYNAKDSIKIGTISNMHSILTSLANSSRIVYPC